MGNTAVAVHLVLAVIIMAGGPLQFIPWIRQHAPAFHRLNGRSYGLTVVLTSIAGLYMVWSRPEPVRIVQNVGVTLDALLIMIFAALAVRYAIARDLAAHRRWALRLFMVVSATWFFRVGFIQWLLYDRAAAGFDPFLNVLAYADYLLPLALLELYLRAKARGNVTERFALASVLFVLTAVMAAGIAVAAMTVWLPRITLIGAGQ
jgi:hypothetical protein